MPQEWSRESGLRAASLRRILVGEARLRLPSCSLQWVACETVALGSVLLVRSSGVSGEFSQEVRLGLRAADLGGSLASCV